MEVRIGTGDLHRLFLHEGMRAQPTPALFGDSHQAFSANVWPTGRGTIGQNRPFAEPAQCGQNQTFDMTPRFSVDFNELLERDLIMLSQTDFRKDINGSSVLLVEGLPIEVQEDNLYDDGTHEVLFARGVVEANSTGIGSHVKWCCRLDSKGFYDIAG
ncbi:hypothetical protein ABIC38_006515 [Variovorax sp. 1126]